MKNEVKVRYDNLDYKISCSTDRDCAIFKVYQITRGKPFLKYMYGTLRGKFLTITLKTGDNQDEIRYFYDEIVRHYELSLRVT